MGAPGPQPPNSPVPGPFASDRLDSWKDIARYLNRDVRTVQRWEASGEFPVYRRALRRLKGSPVYAYKSELDAWLRRSRLPAIDKPRPAVGQGTRWMIWSGALLVALIISALAMWRLSRGTSAPAGLRVVALTSYPGWERFPAFSPDEKQVVFTWNGERQDNHDLYIKYLDSPGEPLRLTADPAVDGWPVWSPDGRWIAFARYVSGDNGCRLMVMPALKGAERPVYDFTFPPLPGTDYYPYVVWTPDGKCLIGPKGAVANGPTGLALTCLDTLESRFLTRPVPGSVGDCCPALSQDGKRLAFLRATAGRAFDLFVMELGTGFDARSAPRRLTSEASGASNPMWTANGEEVLYIAMRDGVRTFCRISHDGTRPASELGALGPIGFGYAISLSGGRLAYSNYRAGGGIWRLDLAAGNSADMGIGRVVASSAQDSDPDVSNDGKKLAFISSRNAKSQVWVSDVDGANRMPLADTIDRFPGPVRWSPGGDQILYECQHQGNDDICMVRSGGGKVEQIVSHPERDIFPNWSRDGRSVYFASNRSGSFQVWKRAVDESEERAVQLTRGGGISPIESVDGKHVYFRREAGSGPIWEVPSGGGEESQVGTLRVMGQNFSVAPSGIYLISTADPEQGFDLWRYPFSSGISERIKRIDMSPGKGISVSPDGRSLYFVSRQTQQGDLYMVESFR